MLNAKKIMSAVLAVATAAVMAVSANAATSKLPAPKTVKASAITETTAKITISSVKDAKGYRIYKLADGKYKKVVDTTKRTYTVKKLESGTTYKLKVAAYKLDSNKKKVVGELSKAVTFTTSKLTTEISKSSLVGSWRPFGRFFGETKIDRSTQLVWDITETQLTENYSNIMNHKTEKLADGTIKLSFTYPNGNIYNYVLTTTKATDDVVKDGFLGAGELVLYPFEDSKSAMGIGFYKVKE